jgi:hypothetical protein
LDCLEQAYLSERVYSRIGVRTARTLTAEPALRLGFEINDPATGFECAFSGSSHSPFRDLIRRA